MPHFPMDELLVDIDRMTQAGFDPSTIDGAARRNELMKAVLASPLGDYIRSTAGKEISAASGGRLLGAEAIRREIEEFLPGAALFPAGYFPIWSSIGGNLIVYGLKEAAFYWAEAGCWHPVDGYIREPRTWQQIEYSSENIPKALIEVSTDSPDAFISDLRSGKYEQYLDSLD
jgi:hypothetical protein